MYRSKWFFHPVFVFICSTLALGLSLFLYIYWYIAVSKGLNALIQNFNLDRDQVLEPHFNRLRSTELDRFGGDPFGGVWERRERPGQRAAHTT